MGKKPKKTLLLVFIHGFQVGPHIDSNITKFKLTYIAQGDDNTFGDFPQHLQTITSPYLPKHRVVTKIFPRYETRGDLTIAVSKLRSWLQDLVIDLEASAGNEHCMLKPSVRTILVCHSMGGIVAADTMLAILDDKNVSGEQMPYMFPCIQGILAFDTPYLGLAPGMFAHNVDSNIKTANAAVSQAALLASSFFGAKTATDGAEKTHISDVRSVARIPPERRDSGESESGRRRESRSEKGGSREHRSSKDKEKEHRSSRDKDRDREKDKHKDRSPEKEAERAERRRRRKEEEERNKSLVLNTSSSGPSSQPSTPTTPSTSTSSWGGWGKVAMLAGAASALAAAGAAAYSKRETISQGFGYVTSHFEFVRELGKGETLRSRLTRASTVDGVGFANLYTSLGPRATPSASILPDIGMKMAAANDATKSFLAQERTFCSEPGDKSEFRRFFIKMVNAKAADEISAHTGMFAASTNPGFYGMSETARDLIVEWAGKRGRRRSEVGDDLD